MDLSFETTIHSRYMILESGMFYTNISLASAGFCMVCRLEGYDNAVPQAIQSFGLFASHGKK